MSKPKPLLKVRITNADHAMEPSGTLDNTSLPKVPIIRIYGLSSTGHKTCVHIHQTWPYLYVEYRDSMTPDAVNKFSNRLLKSLNHAVAISLRKNPADVRSKYIRAIHVVKGVHLYGFHCTWTPFLKIYIIDPQHTIRIATILRSGGIMQQKFQVFESHLSYLLQFMCDFGLYGCGELEISEAWVRQKPVDLYSGGDEDDIDTSMFSVSSYPRLSTMALELDVAAYHILNPLLLAARNIHNSLSIPGLPLPSEPLVLSVRELWEDERKRRVAKGLPPTPSMPASVGTERSDGPGWRAEARLRAELLERIKKEEEDGAEYYPDPSIRSWEDHVVTAFESRGSLWPPEHRVWEPTTTDTESSFNSPEDAASHAVSRTSSKADDAFEIDEVFLTSQGMDNLLRATTKQDEGIDDEVQDDDDIFDELDDALPDDGSPKKRRATHSPQKPLQTSPTKGLPHRASSIHQTPSKEARNDRSSPFRRNLTPSKSFTGGPARANPFREQSHPFSEELLNSPTKPARTSTSSVRRSQASSEAGKLALSYASTASSGSHITSGAHSMLSSGLGSNISARTSESASARDGYDSAQDHVLPPEDKVAGMTRGLQLGEGKDGRSSPSPVLGQQQLSGDFSSYAGNSSGEPATKKRKVEHAGLGTKGVTWLDSLGSFQSPPSFTQRGTLSTPPTTDTRPRSETCFTYPILPPTPDDVLFDLAENGIKEVLHRDPYYSNLKDVPKRSREFAGRLFTLKGGVGVGSLPEWDESEQQEDDRYLESPSKRSVAGKNPGASRTPLCGKGVTGWEYAGGVRAGPPSRREIEQWLEETDGGLKVAENWSRRKITMQSQIIGPTQRNSHGFQVTQHKRPEGGGRESQNMSVLSIEVFAVSRGSLLPNPEFDRIECILFAFQEQDVVITDPAQRRASYICGCMAVESDSVKPDRMHDARIELLETELDLINALIDRVKEWDPDILTGWELQNGSWGYVSERAQREYSLTLSDMIGRVMSLSSRGPGNVKYDAEHTSTFHVSGRHVLNTWRIMRVEQSLTSYSMENVVFHILHRRIPHFSAETLTKWFKSNSSGQTSRVMNYFIERAAMVLDILDETQVVTKNAEFARVFGVEFFSVLSRGSQFKVESFMFRIAKPESLMLLSPSREDVGRQNAAECIPLILEPKSAYYKSPLVVLDFQSLYPSVMIAYNYCYTTCLGRVGTFKGKNKFGVLDDLKLPDGLLSKLKDHIFIAPNGIMYVTPTVRKSLLAKMLTELLDTRVMVKQAMKTSRDDKALLRVLDARQLSLKFICNVTYGYTSASFSGRMPGVEIADSIVQSGRETLEKAITTINTNPKWGAKVVYGDTDSLFVSLEGKTKEQAFRLGNEMADAITAMNPKPIKLKFEKVYFPCVLMAKKRYVGFKYENPDDKEPVFDAKGIETVRRDGIPAGQKMVEKCLKILFRSQDLSEAKAYCQSSWQKLMDGRVSLGDFVFAKEVKLGKYSDKGPPPPGVVVAARRVTKDPRAEAQYGDRVPYVIVRGEPKSRLVDRAFEPLDVLKDRHQYQLDAHYYIEHQLIPPLERVFNLVGANVASWYAEMPKVARPFMPEFLAPERRIADARAGPSKPKFTIDEHFKSASCVVCGKPSAQVLCPACTARPQETAFALETLRRDVQRRAAHTQQICASCCGAPAGEEIECESVDCAWLYERYKAGRELRAWTLTEIARVGISTIPLAVFSPSTAPPLPPLPARFPLHSPPLHHPFVVGGPSSMSSMSSSTYTRNPSLQVTAPTTDWAPNGRALSPPPASPRSAARFAAASSSTGNGSKGASWLFTQLSTRPKISNGIEHQVQQNGGLKPPVIDEADEREGGAEPSNASVLSFSSSVDVASEPGLGRNGTVRSADHVLSRASDDGYVRVNKPSVPSTMRKSDTMPRPRTSDTLDRLKEAASSSSNIPLTSLYLVSGLPKNPATWTLADADSVVGVHHSEGAVGRWWRAEVLGSTITPGVNGGKDKKKKRGNKSRAGESAESKAGLGKGDLGKMLSKSLKLSFPREVEIIASTLQPASTIHSFTFSVPTTRDLTAPASASHLRASVFSTTTAASGTIGDRNSYLGQPGLGHGMHLGIPGGSHIGLPPPDLDLNTADPNATPKETMYHGVCLTVWSHADEERTAAIRRTLETAAYARSRTHKVSMSSMATSIAPSVATSTGRSTNGNPNRPRKRSMPWSGTEVDESETDAGAMTESEADFAGNADGAGASTLFLPQNTVFWLPYALTLVSRHPIYDLMRDYLTLSWARFSKDVQSHTLQIAKILEAPSPRAGDIVRLDAGASGEHLEVVCRFPGGLDFGRGLVDVNFTMWPIFRCLNLDNILTLCEIALAPTGRVLFISRHPAMLGIAVSTLKYLVELRGWNGVAHHNVHARDAKIYLEDPGPWIIAMSTESRYCVRPSPEVCVCDLDINYVNCPSPPPGAISVKVQREKFRKILMGAFDQYFHPDHGVPSEFKEAFPAGRFRPLCKITSKRGSSVVAESIKAPEWWHQTKVVTAFDTVLKERAKKPSFIKRISTLGLINKRPAQLSSAERMIQASIRKRATAFVDARDDLETKIGRLSRRLNFLMTESELWRQKFVAFEGYAEKLSAEAGELRSKINKEQRESKRLSGLVGIAAHEKHMLQQRLVDTEAKHKQAIIELERMKIEMEEMEEEREKMVQDVEAQIERALASMTLSDHYESDSQSSNFSMRSTGRIGAMRSRPGSANSHRHRGLRSFATSSTLAVNAMADEDMERIGEGQDDTMVIEEEEGSGEGATTRKASTADLKQKKRRFSASSQEPHLDGLNAVDVGISQRIDTVAEKMMAIQAKLENAFEHSRKTRSRAATPRSQIDSGDEDYVAGSRPSSRNRPGRFYRSETPNQRVRTYSTQSNGERDAIVARRTASNSGLRNVTVPPVPPLPSQSSLAPQPTLQRMPSGVSLSATRPMTPPEERPPRAQPNNSSGSSKPSSYPVRGGTPAVTDDSGDDSYMSAYSYSPPRTETALHGDDDDDEPLDVIDVTVRHEPSNTSVAEALLQDHDITRDFGKGAHSPLLMARQRSLSNVTNSTARGSYDQEAPPKSAAIAAVSAPTETASPTVSDYSTQSSNTTRFTSVAGSTEC